jgi:eukaryotic-like serine/threonine-protein kinase
VGAAVTTPDCFGRYRVVRRIGSGGFASVWLARDEVLDAPVAVKVLADNWAHRLDVRTRFEEEARILRRADSDRVVRVHDIGELPDGRPYFVMTYADRGTLADRLADGPLPVDAALRYGADIARGLAVLHQVGVIHRDVNPGNVLLRSAQDDTERVLVADLGLAKAAAQGSRFTLAVGTSGYMAPEQARPGDAPLDARADVYALGAVLHYMLTGVPPKQDEPPPPVRSLRPEVPPAVEAVVTRALAIRPEDRYPSAAALADALGAAASGPAAASRPRRRVLVAALAALLVLAGAGTLAGLRWAGRDVTVATADGTISVRVPHDWGRQVSRSSWDLRPYGAPGRSGVALAASPDVARWTDPTADVPGLFAGRADGVSPEALLARSIAAGCPATSSRPLSASGLSGTVTRRQCAGSPLVYVEATLQPPDRDGTVYVQVKEAATADTADEILRSVQVSPAP